MAKRQTKGQRDALELLYQARALVKGPMRTAIESAIDIGENGHVTGLTNLHYDRLQPGQKLTDPKHPGLVMRCGSLAGKYWVFRTSHPATMKQVEIKFGVYPKLGIAEAREMWREMRDERLAGKLPAAGTAAIIEPGNTVGGVVDRYIRDYAKKVKRSWSEDERILQKHIVAKHGETPIGEFDAKIITHIVHTLHDSAPREAEKLMACLSTMFNVAKGRTRKVKITEPWLGDEVVNPMGAVPSLPTREARNHTPSMSEMRAYNANLGGLPELYADALRFQLLTCARITEAVAAPWSEIDLEAGYWLLPAERAKNKTTHKVLLSDKALALLQRRRAASPDGGFVFPSPKFDDQPASSDTASKQLKANRAKLGVDEAFTSHAVRHGMLTWMAENQLSKELRDRVSNHKPPHSADAIYVAAELDKPARIAWQRWADALAETESGNVVLMDEARA